MKPVTQQVQQILQFTLSTSQNNVVCHDHVLIKSVSLTSTNHSVSGESGPTPATTQERPITTELITILATAKPTPELTPQPTTKGTAPPSEYLFISVLRK